MALSFTFIFPVLCDVVFLFVILFFPECDGRAGSPSWITCTNIWKQDWFICKWKWIMDLMTEMKRQVCVACAQAWVSVRLTLKRVVGFSDSSLIWTYSHAAVTCAGNTRSTSSQCVPWWHLWSCYFWYGTLYCTIKREFVLVDIPKCAFFIRECLPMTLSALVLFNLFFLFFFLFFVKMSACKPFI